MAAWDEVLQLKETVPCRCDLRPGMSREDLQPLGAGCTDPWYCCPVLDSYRRKVGYKNENY
jgi:hypothetical protein